MISKTEGGPPAHARIPVIIGIGEVRDRPQDPADGLEPLQMLIRAAQLAERDTGARCLRKLDTVRVVNQISWRYRDLSSQLGQHLRAHRAETIYGPVGGESPVRMLVDAAVEIAAGEADFSLLCGAESLKSVAALRAGGGNPAWSVEDPNVKLPIAEDYVSRYAARYGLINPTDVYPLYENAFRHAWKQSFAEAQHESGVIWSAMSRAAAENPFAWTGKPMSAEDIVAPSDKNRAVSFPYQKFMVAQIGVNQASAVLLTHLDAARAMGIAEEHLIYVGSGAGAHEPHDFLKRDRYDHSSAMEQVLRHTLKINGIDAADVDLFELYSCFPCVPKLARRTLGLSAESSLSVTGGLTFFGGPGNNYMTHAITAMVRALRAGRGSRGLLYGNGEFLTKHHAAVIGRQPPSSAVVNEDLQPALDAQYGSVPALVESYVGPCTIETFVVSYFKGKPDRGTVIARTADGARLAARVTAAEGPTLAFLVDGHVDPVGKSGFAFDGHDGLSHFSLKPVESLPDLPLLFEKLAPHVALVTINRPQKRNVINGAITRLMIDYIARIDNDPQIRVAILTGAGTEAFCGGADLAEVAAGHGNDMIAGGQGFAGLVNAARNKPWIAAIRGSAVGGGTELALACDLVVAGESTRFGLPEVRRGLLPAAAGAYRLPRAIPLRKAMELVLTGETISAADAAALHLINRLVPDAAVLDEALKLAQSIANNAPLAVAASRKLVAACFDATDSTLIARSLDAIGVLMNGEDAQEGVRAFLEKRPPEWKGR